MVVWATGCFQPSDGHLHYDIHVMLVLVGLWQRYIIHLTGLSILIRSHYPLYQIDVSRLARLFMACFALMNNLCNRFGGQVHPSTISPYVRCIAL